MQKLLAYSNEHVLMQCDHCGKIDEIAVTVSNGKSVLAMIVHEWDEPVEKAIDELVANIDRSINELSKWEEAHKEKFDRLRNVVAGWNEFENLYYLMLSTNNKGEVTIKGTPWQYVMLEADRELKASISLAIQGHTKVAYKCLRSYFELSLFGISLMGSGEDRFEEWFNGGKTPSFGGDNGILQSVVNSIKAIQDVPELSSWEDDAKQVYKKLSGYVHTQGKEFSALWLWGNAYAQFEPESWESWLDLMDHQTIQLVGHVLIAIMPFAMMPFDVLRVEGFDAPSGLFVDYKQHQIIADMFSPANLKIAEEIAKKDSKAGAFIDKVKNSRQLSDEEIEMSMQKFLKAIQKHDQYKGLIENITSKFQGTVRWTALFSLQKKVERDIGLAAIANRLKLVRELKSPDRS